MKKPVEALVVAFALCVVVASPVFAYNLFGGKWAGFPQYYYIGGSQVYVSEINAAANSWNNAGTRVSLYRTTSDGYESLWMDPSNFGWTWWVGYTDIYPASTAIPYTYAAIDLNTYHMDGFSFSQRQHIVAHEFGHSIGLAHENGISCVLMNSSGFCAVYPRQDDINGANAVYP